MGSLRQGEKQKQRQEQRNKETSNTLWHKRTVYLRIFQDVQFCLVEFGVNVTEKDCVGGKYHNLSAFGVKFIRRSVDVILIFCKV